jgi:hypothetical protein
MFEEYLEVSYEKQTRKQATFEVVGLLEGLPDWEVEKIAEGVPVSELYGYLDHRAPGTPGVKTASSGELTKLCGGDNDLTFLEAFKGTPLFDQAIALEQEEIQAAMLDQQKKQERRAMNQGDDQLWDARDKIRLRKRLLELELAKQQNGGSPAVAPGPGAEAQGSGAPGPVPAEGVQDSSSGLGGGVAKMGSTKHADEFDGQGLHPSLVSAYRNYGAKQTKGTNLREGLSTVGGAAMGAGAGGALGYGVGALAKGLGANADPKSLAMIGAGVLGVLGMGAGAIVGGSHGNADVALGKAHERVLSAEDKYAEAEEKVAFADKMGRMLARAEFAKMAQAGELLNVGGMAGAGLAKVAFGAADMAGLAGKAVGLAKKNPALAGAAVGAAGGALMGGEGNRLGGALAGGAMGAGAGHAVHGVGAHMAAGASLGDAAKTYGGGMLQKAKNMAAGAVPGKVANNVQSMPAMPDLRR